MYNRPGTGIVVRYPERNAMEPKGLPVAGIFCITEMLRLFLLLWDPLSMT